MYGSARYRNQALRRQFAMEIARRGDSIELVRPRYEDSSGATVKAETSTFVGILAALAVDSVPAWKEIGLATLQSAGEHQCVYPSTITLSQGDELRVGDGVWQVTRVINVPGNVVGLASVRRLDVN